MRCEYTLGNGRKNETGTLVIRKMMRKEVDWRVEARWFGERVLGNVVGLLMYETKEKQGIDCWKGGF